MAIIYNKIITLIGVVSLIFGTVFGTTLPVAQNQLKVVPSEIINSELIYEQIKDDSGNVISGQYSALYKYVGSEIPLSTNPMFLILGMALLIFVYIRVHRSRRKKEEKWQQKP